MTALTQPIFELPENERLELMFEIWDSLQHKDSIPVPEADLIEMEKEIDEYLKDGDAGESWEVVRAAISKKS